MSSRNSLVAVVTLTLVLLGGGSLIYFTSHNSSGFKELPAMIVQTTATGAPLEPLPLAIKLNDRKVALGDRLFNDPILSGDGSVSCAHCHNLATGGVDRQPHSRGIGGKEGGINAPTVFNSGFNFRQFWDGRADTLENQIDGPLQHPDEMASSWQHIVTVLSADSSYRSEFKKLYSDGIQPQNIKDAVATFERSLITPNSRFDRFLRGDKTAMNQEEQAGYQLFQKFGCVSCHQGMNIGGNMYQKLGVMEDYFAARGNPTLADQGRFNVTKQEKDRHFFKVPSLRNVAVTPPYLHDGSAKKLEDVVKVMARFQLGKKIDQDEVTKIVAFLRTLTGQYLGKTLE